MLIDLGTLPSDHVFSLLTQTLIPRPVAWVLTENRSKSFNVAPFSFFNAVASEPPLIMLSIGHKSDGTPKDTRRNCIERGNFVIHIASMDFLESVNNSAAELPEEVSEVEAENLTLVEFPGSPLPRIAGCKVALSCRLYDVVDVGKSGHILIFGQIQTIFVDDSVVIHNENGGVRLDATAICPIARLGPGEYAELGRVFKLSFS